MTAESFAWLVICIYFEARGEPMYAKVRVAHVVMNRAAERNLSVREVIQQPSQFSFYDGLKKGRLSIKEFDAYVDCVHAVAICEAERKQGFDFFKANHYHDHSIAKPRWASQMQVVGRTDAFTFYRG